MGATASINATSKKYKPSEPIEVKFNHVVKYDDGDVKPFKGTVCQNPITIKPFKYFKAQTQVKRMVC